MTGPQRVDALIAADQTLTALSIDQSRPVDPFAAIENLGLDLVIADLDNLLGAVLPHGNGGVMVTSERGTRVQRYTAAHEIAHWILHRDELRLDGHDEVLGRPPSELERQAQLFAAYFLMPPPLIESAIARHVADRSHVQPEQVYLISRDLNVSYEAASRRMAGMGLVKTDALKDLLKVGRLRAMRLAFGGRRPFVGAADLWSAGPAMDQTHLPVREGDDVVLTLPENRTTGWQWLDDDGLERLRSAGPKPRPRPAPPSVTGEPIENLTDDSESTSGSRPSPAAVRAALELVPTMTIRDQLLEAQRRNDQPLTVIADDFVVPNDPVQPRAREQRRREIAGSSHRGATDALKELRVGATGQRTLVVHCSEPGQWTLRLRYAHAHDPEVAPAAEYELHLDVDPTPTHAYRRRRLAINLDARLPGDPDDDEVFEVSPS